MSRTSSILEIRLQENVSNNPTRQQGIIKPQTENPASHLQAKSESLPKN